MLHCAHGTSVQKVPHYTQSVKLTIGCMAYTAWVSTCIGALSACIPYLHGGLYANLKIIFVTFFGGVGLIIFFRRGLYYNLSI